MEALRETIARHARLLSVFASVWLAVIALVMLGDRAEAGPYSEVVEVAPVIRIATQLERHSDRVEQLSERLRAEAAAERAERREARAERLAEVRNAAGEPLELSGDACEENVALAAEKGLELPDGWAINCVGPGLDWNGGSHWGVTCPYDECPEGAGPYVSISNPTYYVVAHELCHANFGNDELMADRCAAEHGASLAESPYQ